MNFVFAVTGLVLGLVVLIVFLPLFNAFMPFIQDSFPGNSALVVLCSSMVLLIVIAVLLNFMRGMLGENDQYEYRG